MFQEELHDLQQQLVNHEIYGYIRTPEQLRTFMQAHVFAVWDFMSLAKRLQAELTCITLPWFTPQDARKARFINEIILGEETDLGFDGQPASHFEMYLAAMQDMNGCTESFERFASAYHAGMRLSQALAEAKVPAYVSEFVQLSIATALTGSPEEVASSFFFGREDAIPHMFQAFLDRWGLDGATAPRFVHYLQRHIDLDGDDHGPAAMKILADLVRDEGSQTRAIAAARRAIQARIDLWDGILADLVREDRVSAARAAAAAVPA
ncbi:DUF3050 domain-containing protein [Pseudomonas sp. NPDC089996]|uniref:DUF3050 domain-containing protein n=1 Tax=Pseudomonas sp. NPDC089996 TaxID=3364474 RepID=UPI00381F9674